MGDRDTVMCFRAFGFEVHPAIADDPEHNRRLIDKMAREQFGAIFITEQIAQTIGETIDRYKRQMIPAIILIPSSTGSLGIGLGRIRDNVEKAVGINILDN